MFTANSMNCLNEAIGLALPGNGTIVATHENRTQLFKDAAELIVKNAKLYYEEGDESVLPRSIATRQAFRKVQKGSAQPNRDKVGQVTWDQIREIAQDKMPDMNCFTLESAMRMVAGTARSMGISVVGEFPNM